MGGSYRGGTYGGRGIGDMNDTNISSKLHPPVQADLGVLQKCETMLSVRGHNYGIFLGRHKH